MAESITDIEDAIKREIEFTAILANSIVARNALQEHDCGVSWCPGKDIGCDEAHELCKVDGDAFQLATEAIAKRFTTVPDIKAEKCECHERDSSQTCSYCQSQGYFGHMQKEQEADWIAEHGEAD